MSPRSHGKTNIYQNFIAQITTEIGLHSLMSGRKGKNYFKKSM